MQSVFYAGDRKKEWINLKVFYNGIVEHYAKPGERPFLTERDYPDGSSDGFEASTGRKRLTYMRPHFIPSIEPKRSRCCERRENYEVDRT